MIDKQAEQVESLIREIAEKHGILVGRDDPILVLQTINHRLLQESAAAQQAQLERFKEELELSAQRWGKDTREKAERIINASLTAAKQATCQLMEEGARTTSQAVAKEVDGLVHRLAGPVFEARRLAVFNMAAACITLLAAGVALWAVVL